MALLNFATTWSDHLNPEVPISNPSRRRSARHRADLAVIISTLADKEHVRLVGRCNEINDSGLGAIIAGEITPGEIASIQLQIPESPQPLMMRAIVRRRKGLAHGFEFMDVTREQRELIRAFCKSQGYS